LLERVVGDVGATTSAIGEDDGVLRRVPQVDSGHLADWCQEHLGSPPAEELFRGGYLSAVIGLRLLDSREVVVKVRPSSPRLEGCVEVHRRLFAAGFPCPEPLTRAVPFADWLATAERYVPCDAGLPTSGRSATAFAEPFARLIELAPLAGDVPDLRPSPAWTAWCHEEGGLWPWPDDRDIDLNAVDGPSWVDDAGRSARDRLGAGVAETMIGHGDWYAGNLCFTGDQLMVAHDWDSVIAESEAVLVGFAAAVYPTLSMGGESTVAETEDFIAAYAEASGGEFSAEELECCWAAGAWQRAFEAKKQYAANETVRSLTEHEARERLRRAGNC
jgi:hypothetical protein